jgi:hypothetical protein
LTCLLVLVAAMTPGMPAVAQEPSAQAPAADAPLRPGAVAAFDVALYTAGANLATSVLRGRLAEQLGPALADSAAVARLASDPGVREVAGDQPCNVIVACVRGVGRDLGAEWVVMAKVSKTSNLIWLLTGQLVKVATGEIVIDDSTELKGDPEPMIRAGVRIFADRVARIVKDRSAGKRAAR